MRTEKILTCYAVKRSDGWEAICVDFDIAVQGDSFSDVTHRLGQALQSYVQYINSLPNDEAKAAFITRRAPWHVRARMALSVILTLLFHSGDDGKRQSFAVACPV